MTTPRRILYVLSMIVAVLLIFGGCVRFAFRDSVGPIYIGLGLVLVLLNSSRADRA